MTLPAQDLQPEPSDDHGRHRARRRRRGGAADTAALSLVSPVRVSPPVAWERVEQPLAWQHETQLLSPGSGGGRPPAGGYDPDWTGGGGSGGGDDGLFGKALDAPPRTNRVTAVLAAGLVVVAGFAGGVWVQKNHDAGLTASAATLTSALRSRASAGGFAGAGGYGGASGSYGGGYGGSGTGTGAASGSGAGVATVPVVVGTVASISGGTLRVKNFADALITVVVPESATVTSTGLGGLSVGVPVSVVGTKAADGTVTAAAITGHRATG
jgi:hypothetical protein